MSLMLLRAMAALLEAWLLIASRVPNAELRMYWGVLDNSDVKQTVSRQHLVREHKCCSASAYNGQTLSEDKQGNAHFGALESI